MLTPYTVKTPFKPLFVFTVCEMESIACILITAQASGKNSKFDLLFPSAVLDEF